jgi:hypothetical protein
MCEIIENSTFFWRIQRELSAACRCLEPVYWVFCLRFDIMSYLVIKFFDENLILSFSDAIVELNSLHPRKIQIHVIMLIKSLTSILFYLFHFEILSQKSINSIFSLKESSFFKHKHNWQFSILEDWMKRLYIQNVIEDNRMIGERLCQMIWFKKGLVMFTRTENMENWVCD